jgi:excinuclease UvrABC ATPase subunit
VRVKNFSIAEFTAMPLSRALMTARNWTLTARNADRRARVDEIRRRLEFLAVGWII